MIVTKVKHPETGQTVDVVKMVLSDNNGLGSELYAINKGSRKVYRKAANVDVTNVIGYETFTHAAQYYEPFSITLVPLAGYQALPWNTVVTMGGEDITSTVYDAATNSINITEVTGDISIEAEAVEMSSDYVPLRYIYKYTHGHYFDLGYAATNKTGIYMDILIINQALSMMINRVNGTPTGADITPDFFWVSMSASANLYGRVRWGDLTRSGTSYVRTPPISKRFTASLNKGVLSYKNNTTDWSLNLTSGTFNDGVTVSYNIRLFGYTSTTYGGFRGYIFRVWHTENDIIEDDYVPVKVLSNGYLGLYNVKKGTLLGSYAPDYYQAPAISVSSSYTSCAATRVSSVDTGSNTRAVIGSTWSIKISPSSGYTFDNKRAVADSDFQVVVNNVNVTSEVATYDAVNDAWTITLVPNENDSISIVATAQEAYYDAELEYLQTDGAAYIDTGLYSGVHGREYLLECRIDDYQEISYVGGTTQGNAYARSRLYLFMYNPTSDVFGFVLGNKIVNVAAEHNSAVHEVLFNAQNLGVYLDGSKIGDFSNNGYAAYYLQHIRLFGLIYYRTSTSTDYFSKSSIYRFKSTVKNGGAVEGDFIPVRKDGVGYMFDNITKTLFGNANESGAFICGPDRLPYVLIENNLTNVVCTRLSLPITGNSEKAVIGQTLVLKYVPMDGYYFVENETTPVITFDGVDVSSDTSKVTITYNSADNSYTLTILNVPDCAIGIEATAYDIIQFEDDAVKAICVANWGGNVINGEITRTEAAAVREIGSTASNSKFYNNTTITKFNEFQYFTGLTQVGKTYDNSCGLFNGCSKLTQVTLPQVNINYLGSVFRSCNKLTSLDLSPWEGNGLRELYCSFSGIGVTSIDLSPLHNIVYTNWAFFNCGSLTTVITTGVSFASMANGDRGLGTYRNMFEGCSRLTTITGGFTGYKYNCYMAHLSLNVASAIGILNSLGTASSKTVTFKSSLKTTYEADSDYNDAVTAAVAKGWTVAYA